MIIFIMERLDEDEEATHNATPGPWWHHPGKQWLGPDAFEKYDTSKGEEFVGYGGPHPFTGAVASTGPASNPQSMADASHIARHNPARVLRQTAALRSVVEDHSGRHSCGVFECDDDDPCLTLRSLAGIWSDHPDFPEPT